MKHNTNIGIDIDEVIRDFVVKLINVYKREYPTHWIKPINTWELKPYFQLGEKINDFWKNKHKEEIYLRAPLKEGANEFLSKLQTKYNLYLVTSQPTKEIESYTKIWLRNKKVPYDELIFSKDKGKFIGKYLLDDGQHNLERCLETGNSIPVAFDKPWNKDWKGKRIRTYQEFLNMVL